MISCEIRRLSYLSDSLTFVFDLQVKMTNAIEVSIVDDVDT